MIAENYKFESSRIYKLEKIVKKLTENCEKLHWFINTLIAFCLAWSKRRN